MKFLIHEIGAYRGIINIKIGNSRISWDFPLGSDYDLCAVFDRRKGRNLRELQLARVRPILFHKELKTDFRYSESIYTDGFLLYPAKLVDGILDIGNQLRGQDARLPLHDRVITVSQAHLVKGVFKSKLKLVKNFAVNEDCLTEMTNDGLPVVFYRIQGNNDHAVYSLPVTGEDVSIITDVNEILFFFSDSSCRNEV